MVNNPPDDLISVKDAAALAGIHLQTVWARIRRQEWPAYRLGHRVMISQTDVERLMAPIPYGEAARHA